MAAGENSEERHYDWNRYWFDRSSEEQIDGFFSSKGSEWFDEGANAWQLSELTSEPCLVLLGEAGLGKSESLREAARALVQRVSPEREVVHLYDLGADQSPELLTTKLMGGRQWDEWVNGGKIFHLFLDSFDEALINQKTLGKLLVRELEVEEVTKALPRLRLRIACRSAEWPSRLSKELHRIMKPAHPEWPGVLPRELVLAQLQKHDVGRAAEAEGLDRWVFLGSISDRGLKGLAALPLTLKMLLETAKESGELPDSRRDLFEQTTRRLVVEYDDLRARPSSGGLQPGQRLAVAERIAAATLFSAHRTIAKRPGKPDPAHLDPDQLSGYYEEDDSAAGGAAFEVGSEQIVEVLRTALFVDAGRDTVRFRHRNLAEFLAASYLAHHGLDDEQILSLFTVSGSQGRELIPQLGEVAAWTAAVDPRVLPKLLELEPGMLRRIGLLHLSAAQAEAIVEGLLAGKIPVEGSPGDNRQLWPTLRSLAHPGLADSLRGPIRDARAPARTRSIAVAIAVACELRGAEADLLAVALDPDEELDLRALAVHGLGSFATQETRRALIPLAFEPIPDDKNDELKGFALLATFPGQIDTTTMFEGLTPPRDTAWFGNYQYFLQKRLSEVLTLADLPVALRWAAEVVPRQDPFGGPADDFNLLVNQLLAMAWPRMAEGEIAAGVTAIVRRRLHAYARTHFPGGGDDPAFNDADGRHVLLGCLIDEIGDDPGASGKIDPVQLLESSPPLLRHSDLGWILDKFESGVGRESSWAALLACVYTTREPGFERIFDLLERSRELRARLDPVLGSIDLGSDLARRLRQAGCDEEPDWSVPADAPYMEQVIAEALDLIEDGDQAGWVGLNDALRCGPRGQDAGCDPLEADIASLPGWKRVDPTTRGRIVAGARSYLDEADPGADKFEGEEPAPRVAAGYRALHLLGRVSRFDFELDKDVWARWIPVILDDPLGANDDQFGDYSHLQLVELAAGEAPEEFARGAVRKVDCEAAKAEGHLPSLRLLNGIRASSLSAALLPKLAEEAMGPRSVADLLKWGLERDWVRSVQLVEPRLLDEAVAHDPKARETATLAAAVFFQARPAAAWPLVKQLSKRDRDLGAAILLQAVKGGRLRHLELGGLSHTMLVDLLDSLLEVITPHGDSGFELGQDRSLRAEAERVCDNVLDELAERGTEEAVATLADIASRFPGHRRGSECLKRAEKAFAGSSVMDPRQIIQTCCSNDPLLISSDEDLQRAVIASLGRIQRSLQKGEPRAARDLWERSPWRPKYEEEVSDWLSRQLAADLRAGGREIYREVLSEPSKTGKGRGQSIDIQITAPIGKFNQKRAENARVVVEVKGSWSKTLKSDMEGQLVEKYLRRSPTSHGIYVVLWFAAEDWTPDDWRRPAPGRMGLEETRELLAKQASDLSDSGEVCVRSVVLDCSL